MTQVTTINLSKSIVNSRTTNHLTDYMRFKPSFIDYINNEAGKEHYKLLVEISHQLHDGANIADVGTYYGASALMLSSNPVVNVTTYDIFKVIPGEEVLTPLSRPNVKMVVQSGHDNIDSISHCDLVVLDIDPHDGKQEPVFISLLREKGFRGLLLCDDINLNKEMHHFWASTCPDLKKVDVTHLGHWSGTGVIVFDPTYIDVQVNTE